jgi:hypothetical protein
LGLVAQLKAVHRRTHPAHRTRAERDAQLLLERLMSLLKPLMTRAAEAARRHSPSKTHVRVASTFYDQTAIETSS